MGSKVINARERRVVNLPGVDLAQYGIALFAVAGVVYLGSLLLKQKSNNNGLAEVIKNNTRALEQVATAVQAIQLSIAKLEAKTEELLERARKP